MSISCQQLALALLLMQMASLNSRGPKLAGVFVHFCWPNNLLTRDSPKSLNYGARKERVMKRISKRIMLMTFLSLAMSGIPARARDSQGSSQDLSQLASRALTLAHPFKTTLDAAIAYALAGQDSKAE